MAVLVGADVVKDVAIPHRVYSGCLDAGRHEEMSGKASRLPTMMMSEFLIAIAVSCSGGCVFLTNAMA